MCAYAVGTGKADAGIRYLYEECKAYDDAKDLELRRALYAQIVDLTEPVVAACEAAAESKAPAGSDVLTQFEAITDPEQRTAFYQKHKAEIWKAQGAGQLPE